MTKQVFEDVRHGLFRLYDELDVGEIDLSDADKLEELDKLADEHLASPSGRYMSACFAAKLVSAW